MIAQGLTHLSPNLTAPMPPNNALNTGLTHEEAGWRWSWDFAEQLPQLCTPWQAAHFKNPQWVWLNTALAGELGLSVDALRSPLGLQTLSGQCLPPQAQTVAQAYAGHQFGHYNPRLGDGRALLLGEHSTPVGDLVDIHLKGSGPTPFSRGGDGFAALGPMLREAIMGEALHHAGIPSSRALAVFTTGETISRQSAEPGAVLVRVAQSHLRVGTFQYAAALSRQIQTTETLQKLCDFACARHYPQLLALAAPERALAFFRSVIAKQAELIARWMAYGFIHGVMNTDNMTISGQTIDFGPCAMLEHFNPDAVFSSIDQHGRYAFGQQARIATWNLARLGESLLALLAEAHDTDADGALMQLNQALSEFKPHFDCTYYHLMQVRLGLSTDLPREELRSGVQQFLSALQATEQDYSLALRQQSTSAPLYLPRNHLVEAALRQATAQDYSAFERLIHAVQHPFQDNPDWTDLAAPASKTFTAQYQTFCGT